MPPWVVSTQPPTTDALRAYHGNTTRAKASAHRAARVTRARHDTRVRRSSIAITHSNMGSPVGRARVASPSNAPPSTARERDDVQSDGSRAIKSAPSTHKR